MGTVVNRPGKWVDLCQGLKMPENPAIWSAVAMLDHFEKTQKLKDKVDGVPNFRRVPGYKVSCCGQPTKEGFAAAIEKACGDKWPKDGPIIWLNMRQEAIVYVNGNPVCARPPNKIGEYAELGDVTHESIQADEDEFGRMLAKRQEADKKIKVVDVNKAESEIEALEIVTLAAVIDGLKEKFPGLKHHRIPICNSAAPSEKDFNNLCAALLGHNINCPVIVNCQVGLSRSTTGSVSACLFREFQIAASYEGLIETVPEVNLAVLKMDRYEHEKEKDTLFRGEFEVVKELIAALPAADAAKRECDKVMDKIHKYFYMICFSAYLREQAELATTSASDEEKASFSLTGGKVSCPTESLKVKKTFSAYMEEHANLRTICEEGKGKLQWERDIPQDDLDNLVNLANSDFNANLGKIIHDIYLTGHNLFRDMPQGDHKKRAKYRFASKTLMRILPDKLKSEVEGLIDQKSITLDLYEILGQCTWGKATAGKSL